MNYIILKSIIEATLVNFKCKNCESQVNEGNINILGTAGNTVNMEIICPNCKTQGIVKAEIGMIGNVKNPEFISNLKNISQKQKEELETSLIKDDDIVKLRKDLNDCSSLNDLFTK
ncbi:hypothetical protein M0P65_00765 [Candidatus Gracilibacteria bacterium]|nr:hypothetical protein [Candidatus Gracilibacteria bacterium]